MRQRDNQSRIHYGKTRSRAWYLRWTFNLFRMAILMLLILRIPYTSIDTHLLIVFNVEGIESIRWLGVVCLTISAGLISYVHSFMSSDWHSGIEGQPSIITTGPFKRSRHPLFQAIMLGMLGLALALPSAFTWVCLVVGIVVLSLQAKLEENTLKEQPSYQRYCKHTPRWLWGHLMLPRA